MRTHVERERKYELSPHDPLPSLDGLATPIGPHDQRLEAVYYDTVHMRLIRAGLTLRKRIGGSDAGWHLKIPAGTDAREELHFPLGTANTPPPELVRLTLGYARTVPLVPVARIVTKRASWRLVDEAGTDLAELTDDHVEAENLSSSTKDHWRELEVELAADVDGALLEQAERLLRDAGLRRAPHGSKLARALGRPVDGPREPDGSAGDVLVGYLARQVDALLRQDLLTRRDAPDAVHQMRVATRRLRAALRAYRTLLDRERVDRIRAELSWLAGRLGPARDLEVMDEHLNHEIAELPGELVLGPVAARLTRYFSPARAQAQRDVADTLATRRYFALLDRLDRLVTDPPLTQAAGRPAEAELPRHVRKTYVRAAQAVANVDGTDEALHEVRKAAKRVRYATEVAVPAIGKPADELRKRAREVATVLGEHQDSVVVRPVLRQLGIQAHQARESEFTFGLLYERERARGADATERFGPAWARLAKKKSRRWLDE
jgi:CHAD domain-containing protein